MQRICLCLYSIYKNSFKKNAITCLFQIESNIPLEESALE